MTQAVEHAAGTARPCWCMPLASRPYSHSLSDDEKLYKTAAERQAEALRDPITRFPEWLINEGILEPHGLELLTHEVDLEIQEVTSQGPACRPASSRFGAALPLFGGSRPVLQGI